MSLKKAVECVRNHKNFLITSHTSLEGDALGSELAFYRLLKKLGKNAVIINRDDVPAEYNFLPYVERIKKFRKNLKYNRFDCFVLLDCAEIKRCGEVYKVNRGKRPILNIDHHISNREFGNINWVEPETSCCSEMIYQLYKSLHIPLDKEIATLLYVGILTDTGSFRYSNTTALTHKVVAELLAFDLDVTGIYKNVYENIPFKDLRLMTKILPTIKRKFKGKIVWFQIPKKFFKKGRIAFDISEQLLTCARAIKGVEVAVLFKENLPAKNEIRVNLRSKGKIDVNKVARFFGGGGHQTASGCTLHAPLDQARNAVLEKIKESL